MNPFTLFRAWLLCAVVWCCCGSLSTAQIYQNSFLYPGANHDHNSVAEAYTSGNTVQAGTLLSSGLNVAHFQEVDDAGNLVWESAKVQSNNIPVRAFHVDQDPFNTLAASGTNNYYFGGILEGTSGNTGVLGFISDGGGMANYVELIAAGWVHTSVLHVSPAETPAQGYLVTGFVAQGFDNTDQKQGFVALVDQASLTVTWSRFIDSNPLYSNDFDLLSNGIELPGQGFFLSGSVNGFGGQNAYAAKFDYAGNLIWDEGYHYDSSPNGEYNIASSAVYDAAGDRIYQLVNLSETHCFAISAYDASAAALVRLPESMTFINGNYSNTAGYSLHLDPTGGGLTVAGLIRDAFASGVDAEGNPISISGSFPFMLNVNFAGTSINWQHTYPIPSSGYSNSSDIYDSFSAGQQPRVLYPEMAHPKADGSGYVLNAFRFDNLTDPYELEALETNLVGQNPCEQEPLGISFFTESWISENVTFIQPGIVDEVNGLLVEVGSAQIENPCGSIQDDDCQFSMDWDYTLDPDICGQVFFQDLTVAAPGSNLCYSWDFGDGNTSTLPSPTHMYLANGVYTVCLTVECCDDPTGASKVQLCRDIVIECDDDTPPCTPDPSFEIVDLGDCCIEIVDLNPTGLSCEGWIITGPDGVDNTYSGATITLCDLPAGTWTICHTDCCINADGSISSLGMCLIYEAEDCGPCVPEPAFSIDPTSNCCYVFADNTPDPDLDCSTWEIINTLDGTVIATYTGEFWEYCFDQDGVFEICHTDCCINPDGTVTTATDCQTLTIEGCGGCTPDPSFVIDPTSNCCYVFADNTPDPDLDCSTWEIINTLDGTVIATYAGEFWEYCFDQDGVFEICHTDCCINPDGTVTTATECQTLSIEGCGGCTPDPTFAIDPTSNCCYAFADLTPDPAFDCSTWEIINTLDGSVVASFSGEFWEYCFDQDGVFEICHTDCCVNADGTITTATTCQSLVIEGCDCVPDASFVIDPIGDCCYAFADPTPDPDLDCDAWEIYDATGTLIGSATGDFYEFCFEEDGTYTVCYTDCCQDATGLLTYETRCEDIVVEGCGCSEYDLSEPLFSVISQLDCESFTLAMGIAPSEDYCIDVIFDGVTYTSIFDPAANLFFVEFPTPCPGEYQAEVIIYCCDDPSIAVSTGIILDIDHDCCCEPTPDFTIEPTSNCCYAFADTTPDDLSTCTGWEIIDATTGTVVASSPGDFWEYCFEQDGVYEVCHTDCCTSFDGTIITDTVCQTLVIEGCGGCELPTEMELVVVNSTDPCEQIGACVNLPDGTGLSADYCIEWSWGDGSGQSEPGNFCPFHTYACNGTYTVCAKIFCCDDPDVVVELCREVTIECACDMDSIPTDVEFALNVDADACRATAETAFSMGGCPDEVCYTYYAVEPGVVVTQTPTGAVFDFPGSGTYQVCLLVHCCDDESIGYSICEEITVDCGCDLPNEDELELILVDSDSDCKTWGACVTLPAGSDPTDYCIDWHWGDGTVQTESAAFCPLHTYDCNGAYEVCAHLYCCDDPDNVVIICGGVEVNCPCTLPQVDFVVNVNDDCSASATIIGEGVEICPEDICYNWIVVEPGVGIVTTGTGANFTFPGDGVYQICLEVFCCIDPTISYSMCQLVTVDCPCEVPTDLTLDIVQTADDCKQIGVCVFGGSATGADLCVDYDWGDGTTQSEILDFCPIHTYACSGVYEVCATVYCCDDPTVSVTICDTVVIECPCDLPSNVDFTLVYNEDCTVTPIVELPTDPCDNICYNWFSPQAGVMYNPLTGTFSFPGSGTYSVCLDVFCCDGTGLGYTVCQEVEINCCQLPSSIGFDPIVEGCTVNPNLWYTDDYTGPLCFFWDFGDGTTSTDENATHTYMSSGTYTICLTVSCCDDPTGSTAITVCNQVTVECDGDCPEPCELYPAFNALMDPISVETGCCMQFYNNSMSGPHTTVTGYFWDFGDGATSTDANPYHCFLMGPGAYTVCLTVYGTSPDGDCQETFCFTFNCDCEDTCPEDVNHDGFIGVSDLLQILGSFQQECP